MCGLPLSPVPLSQYWTPLVETERHEKTAETWRSTTWTWETKQNHQTSTKVTKIAIKKSLNEFDTSVQII